MTRTPTVITATQMQQKSGWILKQAFQQGQHFVVERGGYPVVAIIPIQEYAPDGSGRSKPKHDRATPTHEAP